MKIFGFLREGKRRLGVAIEEKLWDLSPAMKEGEKKRGDTELLQEGFFQKENLERRIAQGAAALQGTIDFDLPFASIGKILAIGKNFAAHAREFGAEVPIEPIFFAKLPNTLLPHGKPIALPYWLDSRMDHEAELGVLIGKRGKYISEESAMDYVAGYTMINDVTARTLQGEDRKEGHPWLRSKSLDGSAPCGPFWIPAEKGIDPRDFEIHCTVNGEIRQKAKISEMVCTVETIIAYLSRHMTLEPGDLIAMGTPSGVGPLHPGDRVRCTIDKIGSLENPVVREKLPHSQRDCKDINKIKLFENLEKRIHYWREKIPQNEEERWHAKVIDLLHDSLPHFHWTGIYRLEGENLFLGPYRGKPTEHIKIPVGRGICGRAVAENQSIVVEDVTKESNYLACSLETRSEIVVPFYREKKSSEKSTSTATFPARLMNEIAFF